MPFLHCISSFGATSHKNLKDTATRYFYSLFLVFISFTSADIIFHKFLKLHSALSEKQRFLSKFSFFTMDSLGEEGGQKALPTSFSPVTSTNVEIIQQNFVTFGFNPSATLA